jgi:hypothetical protein
VHAARSADPLPSKRTSEANPQLAAQMSGVFDVGVELRLVRAVKLALLCQTFHVAAQCSIFLPQERSFKEWSARPENASIVQEALEEELQASLTKQEEAAYRRFREQVCCWVSSNGWVHNHACMPAIKGRCSVCLPALTS